MNQRLAAAPKLIIVVTPNFNMATTVGFIDPFRVSNYLDGKTHFRWEIASVNGGTCIASNGMSIETLALQDIESDKDDLIIVSSSWAPETYNTAVLHASLRKWARQGCTLGALDTGAFILAEAKLLSNRRATVHYEHIDALSELFPSLEVSENMFVFDGNRITCCGGFASVDFALHIIQSSHGVVLANAAARYLFHEKLRPRGAAQNAGPVEPLGSSAPASIKSAIKIMEENLEDPISVPKICTQIGLSQRQLNRLFTKYVQKPPSLYYRDIRLDRARGLVTQTDMLLSEVAVASGFSGQVHFSRAYRDRFGLPPSADRVEGRVPFEFRAWPMHRKKK